MNIISLNILFVDDTKKVILTESPYLFVNENLRKIIDEIRKIVNEDFPSLADEIGIPITSMSMGMTTFTDDRLHFFEVSIKNILKMKDDLLNV